MYSWSPNLSQISLKNSFGKVVFQILAEIEMTRNENRLFGRHFETVQIFYIFFSWNMVVISVYTYGVKIIKKFRWESGFLWGGSMEPPLCTNGSAGYLMQLSVTVWENQVIWPNPGTWRLSKSIHSWCGRCTWWLIVMCKFTPF